MVHSLKQLTFNVLSKDDIRPWYQVIKGSVVISPLGIIISNFLAEYLSWHMHSLGFEQIVFPSYTHKDIWKYTSRLDKFGASVISLGNYILSPTAEEIFAFILKYIPQKYFKWMQHNVKYRREPRDQGLFRSKEFRMHDSYSSHPTRYTSYMCFLKVIRKYVLFFQHIGLDVTLKKSSDIQMGDSISYEFVHFIDNKEIELGHVFHFLPTAYSSPFQLSNTHMNSYGIGINRILWMWLHHRDRFSNFYPIDLAILSNDLIDCNHIRLKNNVNKMPCIVLCDRYKHVNKNFKEASCLPVRHIAWKTKKGWVCQEQRNGSESIHRVFGDLLKHVSSAY